MYQEPGLAWLERQAEVAEELVAQRNRTAEPRIMITRVGRLELWPASSKVAWWRLCWRPDLRFLGTRGDRW
jgi:hypothetical protein